MRVSLQAAVFLFVLPNNLLSVISLHHEHLYHFIAPFNFCMASFFIRVDAANEAVYELVAEPVQEPPAREQQIEEAVE